MRANALQRAKQDYFSYVVEFSANTSGASTAVAQQRVQPLNIQADADFLWTHGYCHMVVTATGVPYLGHMGALTGGGSVPTYPFLLQILDARGQREITNGAVPLDTMFRVPLYGGPHELPYPRRLLRNSVLRFTLTRQYAGSQNAAGAVQTESVDVRLTLEGYRLYDEQALAALAQ